MVFHNQKNDIQDEFVHLEKSLINLGCPHHNVQADSIIRNEDEYCKTSL